MKRFTLLPVVLLALTGCCNPIHQLQCLVEDSTEAILERRGCREKHGEGL